MATSPTPSDTSSKQPMATISDTPNTLQQSDKQFDFGESYNCDENDGPTIIYMHVQTREMKRLPEPQWPELVSWNGVPPDFPPSSVKSADETMKFLREQLPRLMTILRLHHAHEKLDEKPAKGTWTIVIPRIANAINVIAWVLNHARKANGVLPSPLVKKLNTTHKITVRAAKLAHKISLEYASNASFLELYYDVVPKALEKLTDLLGAC